jgi:hypothetical protein
MISAKAGIMGIGLCQQAGAGNNVDGFPLSRE